MLSLTSTSRVGIVAITNNASHQRHESALKAVLLPASSSYAMDDFAVELLAARRDESPERPPEPKAPSELDPSTASPHRSGLRGGLAALREKANIQDRLVEKSVLPILGRDQRRRSADV